jgi:ribosome modulation factor
MNNTISVARNRRRGTLNARLKGKAAAIAGKLESDNPYRDIDTGRAIAWREGWEYGSTLLEEPVRLEL